MGELDKYLVEIKQANPCQECARNIAECPWLHSDTPVPGWDATPSKIKLGWGKGNVRLVDSFEIHSCPLYIPVPERNVNHAELTPEQNRWFLERSKFCDR